MRNKLVGSTNYELRTPNSNGQSLMELVVVIAVIIIVVAALTFATIASLRNASFSQNQAQATKLAQEGLEKMRSLRDRDTTGAGIWSTSTSCSSSVPSTCPVTQSSCPAGGCYFFFNSSNVLKNGTAANSEAISPGNFKRQFFIEDIGVDQKKVTVVVTWIDVSGPHESRLTTILRRK